MMKSKGAIPMRIFLFSAAATVAAMASAEAAAIGSFTDGPIKAKSYSKLAFSPDGILFVSDSIGARIYALDLGDRQRQYPLKPLPLRDSEGHISPILVSDP